jgi:cephalosporin-C deacetylase-like acetyl esterase
MRPLLLLVSFVITAPALAVFPPAGKEPAPNKMLYAYLRGEAQKHFDARTAVIAGLKTPQDVEKRQVELKAKFTLALGGFPPRTPLKPQVVGTIKGDGYRIERVIYESRPDHHVTALLYLPEGQGPFPGVLMPLGHYANGKSAGEVQRGCILFAKNGLAVLAYDPIGQGERRQLLDAKGKSAIGSSTTEHTLVGVGALLVGESTATYRIWDGIRSLDYLASRPEIDPKRLGCTGCSGGGTLTSYLMALDDRILCAAPSCYITSLERLFDTLGPQDAEQNITGQVAFGMNHADYLLMRAPRPTLICCATKDFFDIQGTWTTFREASQVYGLMGHPERVALVEANTGHGYSKQHREAVVRWMCRWLLGKDTVAVEPDFPILKDEVLQCTRSGQVLSDFKGKSAFYFNAARANALAELRPVLFAKRTPDELVSAVRELLALPNHIEGPKVTGLEGQKRATYDVQKFHFGTEPGITVPGMWFKPHKVVAGRKLIVYAHGDGMAAQAGPGGALEKLVEAGDVVLAIDLRGLGETAPGKPAKKPSHFGSDVKEAFLALHLNRPLLGQRVVDLLSVVEMLAADPEWKKLPLHLVGVGTSAPVALHAAALDKRIQSATLHGCVVSWTAVAKTPMTINQLTSVVPGALKVYDLPDLAAAMPPRPLTLRGVVDAALEPVSRADLEAAYAGTRGAYAALKAGDLLVLHTDAK